jgi:hypothetical protein
MAFVQQKEKTALCFVPLVFRNLEKGWPPPPLPPLSLSLPPPPPFWVVSCIVWRTSTKHDRIFVSLWLCEFVL